MHHRTFVGLAELNTEIKQLLTTLNKKPFQKLARCRSFVFLEIDKPALRALPQIAYEYREYRCARAGVDYHVELSEHYYSVLYQYCNDTVECYVEPKKRS